MLKRHSQLFELLFTASDLLVVSFAWILSYWIRFSSDLFIVDKGIPPFAVYVRMLLFVWFIWASVFKRAGLYKPMRSTNRYREVWLVVHSNSLSVLMLLAVTYLFREKSVEFSRLVFVIFWVSSTVLLLISRGFVRVFLRKLRSRGYNLRYALIVGADQIAIDVARRLVAHPEYGIELVGCLSRDRQSVSPGSRLRLDVAHLRSRVVNAHGSLVRVKEDEELVKGTIRHYDTHVDEVRVIGTYGDLPEILEQGGVDQVIVALPLNDSDRMESVIASIGDHMVDVRIVPDFHRFIQLGSLIEEFNGLPVVSLASTPLSGVNRALKRIMDAVLGTIFFIIALPVMLFTAVLIKITSHGPIFFKQERVGLDGQRFQIYKFRTMKINAESGGAKFATKDDPRTTAIGKFLRKYSIDELPQLINVIRGQMSLVGPRPERPIFIEEFRKRFPGYMLRHKVQAGMTGWAQVNGWRGNTSIKKRVEHDLYYIEHWSLGLDLKIIFLTILKNFRDKNAY